MTDTDRFRMLSICPSSGCHSDWLVQVLWTLYPGFVKEASRRTIADPMIFETDDGELSVEGLYKAF